MECLTDRARSPASKAATTVRTRSFSATMWAARRATTGSSVAAPRASNSGLTSRSDRIDGSRRARPSTAASHCGPPDVVLGRFEAPLGAGVADDERDLARQGDRSPFERPAVEQQRDPGQRARDGELVHEPGLDADERVLCSLADPGERQPIDVVGGVAEERPGDGQLDRRRRGQAGILGQGRGDDAAQASGRQSPPPPAPRPSRSRSRSTSRSIGTARRGRSPSRSPPSRRVSSTRRSSVGR